MRYCIPFCLCVLLLVSFAASSALSAECVVAPSGKVVCPVPVAVVVPEAKSCDGPLCVVPRVIVPYTQGSNRPIATKPVVERVQPVRKIIKRTGRFWQRQRVRRFFQRARVLRGRGCCG